MTELPSSIPASFNPPAQGEMQRKIEEPHDGMDIDNQNFGKRVAALNLHECNLLDVRIRNDIFKAVQNKLCNMVMCNLPAVELSVKAGLKDDPGTAR